MLQHHPGTPVKRAGLSMELPVEVGDYVDAYAGLHHATNLGRILRPGTEPLNRNWRNLLVMYHGRSGTMAVSGTPVQRPVGQVLVGDEPVLQPTGQLDIELGYAYLSTLSFTDVVAPHMEQLVAQVHESSSVSVLDCEDIVYVVRVPTTRIMAEPSPSGPTSLPTPPPCAPPSSMWPVRDMRLSTRSWRRVCARSPLLLDTAAAIRNDLASLRAHRGPSPSAITRTVTSA